MHAAPLRPEPRPSYAPPPPTNAFWKDAREIRLNRLARGGTVTEHFDLVTMVLGHFDLATIVLRHVYRLLLNERKFDRLKDIPILP